MKHKRKYIFALAALLFALSLHMSVAASLAHEPAGYISVQPLWSNVERASATLSFSGTTAHCRTTITGLPGTTRINALMRLERVEGGNVVWSRSWSQVVNGSMLTMNESAAITASGNYRLRVHASVLRNGTWEDISISG
ncbi:MAG: hypothetical protein FWC70_04260 [Defluviitaleaceae bacterium]|nr:hypothetical protein [Defluviitaleaceae bacterium]